MYWTAGGKWALLSRPFSPSCSFFLSDISPFSSNHFLPFGPLFFLMQLSLIHSFLPLSLSLYDFYPSPPGATQIHFLRFSFLFLVSLSSFSLSLQSCSANNTVSTIVSCTYCSWLFALTWLSSLFWSLVISLPYPLCVTTRFSLINITLQICNILLWASAIWPRKKKEKKTYITLVNKCRGEKNNHQFTTQDLALKRYATLGYMTICSVC